MSDKQLKPWPDLRDYAVGFINGEPDFRSDGEESDYHSARADAATERLRLAVPHIRHAMSCDSQLAGCVTKPYDRCTCGAVEALAAIGDPP